MAFFESIPQPPPPEPPARQRRRPWMQPETVIPGSVTGELLLVRNETVAVTVGSLRAYPNGFEFALHVRLRRDDDEYRQEMSDPFDWHASRRRQAAPGQALRLGILYADGRRTATTGRHLMLPADEAGDLVLQQGGSSGSSRRWDGDFWVHPLPPDGPVTFVASWLAYEVTEARAQVEGSDIRAAASRAIELWPDDPDDEPSSGWTSGTITAGEPGE